MLKERGKNILITVGSGFLGTNIIKFLAQNDEKVVATTRSSPESDPLIKTILLMKENLLIG